jgi:hypothetical protein
MRRRELNVCRRILCAVYFNPVIMAIEIARKINCDEAGQFHPAASWPASLPAIYQNFQSSRLIFSLQLSAHA